MSTDETVDRRTFLKGAAAVAGATALGGSVLTGCSTKSSSRSGAINASVKLPTYVPYTGVRPDLPPKQYVQAGFFGYPKNLVQFTQQKPLKGDTVSAMTNANQVPPPLANNLYWQQFNQQAGGTVNIDSITLQYNQKLEVAVAGGDLPDIVFIGAIPNLPQLLQAKFTDLSPWLSGDKVKKYPGLANIPTISWYSSVYNGGIYTIPLNREPFGAELEVRADIVAAKGGSLDVKSYADFLRLARLVNDPKNNRWAMPNPDTILVFIREMLGNANNWAVDKNGKFTRSYEQATYKKAIDSVASMWKEGLFHPDAYTKPNGALWIGTGVCVMTNGSGFNNTYANYQENGISPTLELREIVPPKYDGGGDGHKYLGPATYGKGVAILKSDKRRVEELLSFFNWLAAPFGTKEYMFFRYGVEGHDFTYNSSGVPVKTKIGSAETSLPVNYLGEGPAVNEAPGHPGFVRAFYAFQERCAKIAMQDPTLGLYSSTDQSRGASLTQKITSVTDDIITGRQPLSAWDDAVATWRSTGGNTIRKEYQQAYSKVHGRAKQ